MPSEAIIAKSFQYRFVTHTRRTFAVEAVLPYREVIDEGLLPHLKAYLERLSALVSMIVVNMIYRPINVKPLHDSHSRCRVYY